ncbi:MULTISPECIES: GNAT family N-acetyltransferase [Nocardiaceae]|uniref:Ribosomal protein S18 acetylase RimI-like enzyme n=1 Tax=Rhodococcoides corynebacterioides TaxID=53972 RepID=A0ABS2KZJ9_9NOCA|nr:MULTISPECIES: GNAT family N-acetyltransferase [Rhodococcus]MBM7417354.1 ribosomal protein S18 acetylase RimI-like enzyme [Rhodococcus corynebacterioides]MBP1115607.1 ribosomal protein S18 acetylase RimI-like enzyme [Rhodococcus sp. PvP016]
MSEIEPGVLTVRGGTAVTIRAARRTDLGAVVDLLLDDPLGRVRESAIDLRPYEQAFDMLAVDPNQHAFVVTDGRGNGAETVVATFQLAFLTGLSRRGTRRAQIESVRVAAEWRDRGLGTEMVRWAVDLSRRNGCGMVQLTTDNSRHAAHRFYERLGFTSSHTGYRLVLGSSSSSETVPSSGTSSVDHGVSPERREESDQ